MTTALLELFDEVTSPFNGEEPVPALKALISHRLGLTQEPPWEEGEEEVHDRLVENLMATRRRPTSSEAALLLKGVQKNKDDGQGMEDVPVQHPHKIMKGYHQGDLANLPGVPRMDFNPQPDTSNPNWAADLLEEYKNPEVGPQRFLGDFAYFVSQGDWTDEMCDEMLAFLETQPPIQSYGPYFQNQLHVWMAAAYLKRGRGPEAQRHLDRIDLSAEIPACDLWSTCNGMLVVLDLSQDKAAVVSSIIQGLRAYFKKWEDHGNKRTAYSVWTGEGLVFAALANRIGP